VWGVALYNAPHYAAAAAGSRRIKKGMLTLFLFV